jgi:hypothetical protein
MAVMSVLGTQFERYDSRFSEVSIGWQGVVARPSSDMSNGLSRSSPLLACMVRSTGSSSSLLTDLLIRQHALNL